MNWRLFRALLGLLLAAIASPMSVSQVQHAAPPPTSGLQIAISFDDLPAHGSLPPGTTRLEIARKILAALHDAGVPPTVGFENGQLVEREPADIAVLDAWRAAGQPLGNHAWSHMDLNRHTLAEFEEDIRRNEPQLARLMKDGDWHWFRFPYLSEGDTPEKKAGIRAFLAQNGYRIAPVTMSFADYEWTEAYARCKAKDDQKAVAALQNTFLAAADETINYSRDMSHTLYARDIPYVLLLHIGALDAEMLPKLLELYRARGFTFVSLAQAEADEFYRGSLDPSLPLAPDSLDQAMTARGLPLLGHATYGPLLDLMCR